MSVIEKEVPLTMVRVHGYCKVCGGELVCRVLDNYLGVGGSTITTRGDGKVAHMCVGCDAVTFLEHRYPYDKAVEAVEQ